MTSTAVRTLPSTPTSPPAMLASLSPYGTRSTTKKRNLGANFAAVMAKKYQFMREVGHLVIFKEGVKSANPSDLFWFVSLTEVQYLPDFIVADKAMTPVERCKRILLVGNGDKFNLDCKVFARIEIGKSRNVQE